MMTHQGLGCRFHWYCRFYQGRRGNDDERQIGRWKGVCGEKGRWKRSLVNKVVLCCAVLCCAVLCCAALCCESAMLRESHEPLSSMHALDITDKCCLFAMVWIPAISCTPYCRCSALSILVACLQLQLSQCDLLYNDQGQAYV